MTCSICVPAIPLPFNLFKVTKTLTPNLPAGHRSVTQAPAVLATSEQAVQETVVTAMPWPAHLCALTSCVDRETSVVGKIAFRYSLLFWVNVTSRIKESVARRVLELEAGRVLVFKDIQIPILGYMGIFDTKDQMIYSPKTDSKWNSVCLSISPAKQTSRTGTLGVCFSPTSVKDKAAFTRPRKVSMQLT